MSGDYERPPKITEPAPVTCSFLDGVAIEVRAEFVRIAGYIDLETAERGEPERRIVVRAALPTLVVRALILDLRRAVSRDGN